MTRSIELGGFSFKLSSIDRYYSTATEYRQSTSRGHWDPPLPHPLASVSPPPLVPGGGGGPRGG